MRNAITLLLVVGGALLAAPGEAQTPSQVDRGKQVYAAQKCSICHSIDGKGNLKGALDAVGAKLSADEIRQWIVAAPEMTAKAKATRKPAMRAYPNLPQDDLDALVGYLQTLRKK